MSTAYIGQPVNRVDGRAKVTGSAALGVGTVTGSAVTPGVGGGG